MLLKRFCKGSLPTSKRLRWRYSPTYTTPLGKSLAWQGCDEWYTNHSDYIRFTPGAPRPLADSYRLRRTVKQAASSTVVPPAVERRCSEILALNFQRRKLL